MKIEKSRTNSINIRNKCDIVYVEETILCECECVFPFRSGIELVRLGWVWLSSCRCFSSISSLQSLPIDTNSKSHFDIPSLRVFYLSCLVSVHVPMLELWVSVVYLLLLLLIFFATLFLICFLNAVEHGRFQIKFCHTVRYVDRFESIINETWLKSKTKMVFLCFCFTIEAFSSSASLELFEIVSMHASQPNDLIYIY